MTGIDQGTLDALLAPERLGTGRVANWILRARNALRGRGTWIAFSREWKDLFEFNALRTFDDFWNLERTWQDKPNMARKGWSTVSLHRLKRPDGGTVGIYLKRQQNYFLKQWVPFVPRIPVSFREAFNLLCFRHLNIPTCELLSYGEERDGTAYRAMSITASLDDYATLKSLCDDWIKTGWPSHPLRLKLVSSVARLVSEIHGNGYRHNMLYPKHIMVRKDLVDCRDDADGPADNGSEVRIIDLESTTNTSFGLVAVYRDLEKMHRHTPEWSRTDKLRFFKLYSGRSRLSRYDKWLIGRILTRADRKKNRKRWRPKRRR